MQSDRSMSHIFEVNRELICATLSCKALSRICGAKIATQLRIIAAARPYEEIAIFNKYSRRQE